jgi:integrase
MAESGLTEIGTIEYLLSLGEGRKMKGLIRPVSRQTKCPKCGDKFNHYNRLGYVCDKCKTSPGKFYIDLHWNGQRPRICSDQTGQPLDSYQRAQNLLAKIQAEIDSRTFDPTRYVASDLKKYWVSTLVERFLEERIEEIAPSNRKDYRRYAHAARSFFRTTDIRELRKLHLNDYKAYVEKGYKPNGKTAKKVRGDKTVKNYLDWLKTFLNYCKNDLEIIDRVPTFPIVLVNDPEWRWVDAETRSKILSAIPEADRPIIEFLMLSGCRPGEARALRVKRVDLRTMSIEIRDTFSGGEIRPRRKGRNARPNIIPIHPEMQEYLVNKVNSSLPEAFVLTNPRTGGPYTMSALNRLWDSIRTKLDLSADLKLYDSSRHSVGSQLGSMGASLHEIRDILGHSSTRMTERYVHHDKLEQKRATLAKLSLKTKPVEVVEIKRRSKASGLGALSSKPD